jgi:hypothetical protein
MNNFQLRTLVAACSLTFAGAAAAQTTAGGSSSGITTAGGGGTSAVYLKRTDTRFSGFTGSTENTESLARGLRSGSEITLTGSGETVTFTPPTKPMGYGNVTRALDLAQRDLAAAGITDPTPSEIQIAMMGGTITRADGTTATFDGVLQLRADGMGWGQIAHTIGVHPGMGKSGTVAAPANGAAAAGLGTASSRSGIVTAGGGSAGAVSNGNGRALGHSGGGTVTTAAGGSAGAGAITSAGAKGQGQGNAFGRSK